jgi:hypothetical protein
MWRLFKRRDERRAAEDEARNRTRVCFITVQHASSFGR